MTRSSRGTRRAYTIIEVMIALTILAIGASGIIAMQKYASVANRDAKNLVIASQIARTWLERLRVDALQWNDPSASTPGGNDLNTDTLWLANNVTGTWFRPTGSASRGSPGFDALGADVVDSDAAYAAKTVFCTNVRLTWLYGPVGTVPPPYLIRAEVRVYWLREGGGGVMSGMGSGGVCNPNFDVTNIDTATVPATQTFHFVYAASALRQNQVGF